MRVHREDWVIFPPLQDLLRCRFLSWGLLFFQHEHKLYELRRLCFSNRQVHRLLSRWQSKIEMSRSPFSVRGRGDYILPSFITGLTHATTVQKLTCSMAEYTFFFLLNAIMLQWNLKSSNSPFFCHQRQHFERLKDFSPSGSSPARCRHTHRKKRHAQICRCVRPTEWEVGETEAALSAAPYFLEPLLV